MSENTEKAFFELLKSGLFGHTETTDSTEYLWFKVKDSWFMVEGFQTSGELMEASTK